MVARLVTDVESCKPRHAVAIQMGWQAQAPENRPGGETAFPVDRNRPPLLSEMTQVTRAKSRSHGQGGLADNPMESL